MSNRTRHVGSAHSNPLSRAGVTWEYLFEYSERALGTICSKRYRYPLIPG
jgi:hypothetical protein